MIQVLRTKLPALLPAACLIGLLAAAGCGSDLPATSPATGIVLHQGEPLAGATVLFSRGARDIAEGEIALGMTDAEGRFELTTHVGSQADVKGAVPGQYEVTISKRIPPRGMSESQYQALVDAANKISETGAMVPPDQQPPEMIEMLPPQYSAIGRSELSAQVTEGASEFQFDLQ